MLPVALCLVRFIILLVPILAHSTASASHGLFRPSWSGFYSSIYPVSSCPFLNFKSWGSWLVFSSAGQLIDRISLLPSLIRLLFIMPRVFYMALLIPTPFLLLILSPNQRRLLLSWPSLAKPMLTISWSFLLEASSGSIHWSWIQSGMDHCLYFAM